MIKYYQMIKNIILIFFTSLFLIFSFPNFNLSFLAFISFIPLFFAIENRSPKKAFLIFYISGFIFYFGTLYWLYHVTIIGLMILCLYLALYFGVFGLICFRFKAYSLKLIAIPLIWSLLEYIQSHVPIMGFGWLSLGYSQYKNLPLIQIADFSGVYGVSFVIMMVNVGVCMSLRGMKRRSNLRKSIFAPLAMTSLVLIASCIYGFYRLNEKHNAASVKISVIQGNIAQELKWDPQAQDMIIEKYTALTKMAALERADLIVWPETSFPGFFEIDEDMTEKVLALAKEIKTSLLIGVNTEKDERYFNSAALISPEGSMIDKYDKIHLVPFGEYVPFSNKFPALHKLVLGELGEFTPGNKFTIFTLHPSPSAQVSFAALVCFEDIFPEISRKFVNSGAKFLVVITNDAWYGRSGAAYQHAACSVFRAIENRVPVVRCANTGYSCFIDSKGKIYDSVEEKNARLFITGYRTATVNTK